MWRHRPRGIYRTFKTSLRSVRAYFVTWSCVFRGSTGSWDWKLDAMRKSETVSVSYREPGFGRRLPSPNTRDSFSINHMSPRVRSRKPLRIAMNGRDRDDGCWTVDIRHCIRRFKRWAQVVNRNGRPNNGIWIRLIPVGLRDMRYKWAQSQLKLLRSNR